MAGQGTPATALLRQQRVAHRVHAYPHDPRSASYGTEAANALGIDPAHCFKTLVAEVDGALVTAVVPVTGALDLKALAGAVGGKRAAMAEPTSAERTTGYVRGGISPLGQRKRLPTVVDSSAVALPTIYVSAGRHRAAVAMAPADLVRLTDAVVAAIAG